MNEVTRTDNENKEVMVVAVVVLSRVCSGSGVIADVVMSRVMMVMTTIMMSVY